jgi:N-acyl-phosphatidylethanolamine-hydrolysing phospholipase D
MRSPALLMLSLALLVLAGCVTDCHSRPPAVRGIPVDDASAPVSAVWIGHATVLFRLGEHQIVADANFSSRQFVYPRITAPSVRPEELPPVDFALVSHLHNDHFDVNALRALKNSPTIVFPRGAAGYTRGVPGTPLFLEAWEATERDGVKVTAVPARHTGGRYFFDGYWNRAFTGFVVEAAGHAAYFAGDTGYDPDLFKEIGKRFPRIDIAFVPIAPARGGNTSHASPAEAVQILQDLGARFLVPIHYEAFYSSVVPYDEPRTKLAEAAAKAGVSDRVWALHTGERILIPDVGVPQVTRTLPPRRQNVALESTP